MKLKPCPFCGNSEINVHDIWSWFNCVCEKCETFGPRAETKEDATRLWNTRAFQFKDRS